MKMLLRIRLKSMMILLALTFLSCAKQTAEPAQTASDRTVTIHLNDRRQTIHSFGASDAWCIQYLGQWPEAKRNQVADWLFSSDNDAMGNPKGIGLSMWRFNIGAGSTPQGSISDEWRSTEGFLNDDLTYDWSRQAGQRWFVNAAKARGVKYLLGFTNSPPVQLTKNGKAFSGNGEEANIAASNYKPFAKFLTDVALHFKDDGTPFDYISPFNEPQWDWTGNGQEGSPYKNSEIFAITRILDSTLVANNVEARIQVAEAGKLNYLYEKADKSSRGEQIKTFFDPASPLYLGGLPRVERAISGHSYFTSAPVSTLTEVRTKVASEIKKVSTPLQFWQSEYCILGDQEEIKPSGKDTGMAPALYVARVIHHDLTIANANAWHWWLSVSAYDYKDGLIYMEKNKADGTLDDTKLLWALGNFSRFITPGSERLEVSSSLNINNADGVMISSFQSASKEVVCVVINYGQLDSEIKLTLEGGDVEQWQPFFTGAGADEDLKAMPKVSAGETVTIPKRSITTFVGQLQP
jgi:O-glycosyl hydrolase